MMKYLLSASLACANPIDIHGDVNQLEQSSIDAYHLDFCDGVFAHTFLLNSAMVKALRSHTKKRLDVHIYGHHPSYYLEELKSSDADVVIVQVEMQGDDYTGVIDQIARMGMTPGVGILPTTSVPENFEKILEKVSVVVTNTVGPAFAGQAFSPRGLDNMRAVSKIAKDLGVSLEIVADGGVSKDTLPILIENGANHFVLGTSTLFHNAHLRDNVEAFRCNLENLLQIYSEKNRNKTSVCD